MPRSCEVRRLGIDDVGLIARIDRSEHVDAEYAVVDGRLIERPVSMADIPPWDPVGVAPYSVAAEVAFCAPLVAGGATLLGAYERDRLLGLAVVDGSFEPGLAWLAFLYVNRPDRRRGVAAALWGAAVQEGVEAGAVSIYVSATPTGSAVGFYLSRGCRLADPVHPALYAKEPDDIHLVCSLPEAVQVAQASDTRRLRGRLGSGRRMTATTRSNVRGTHRIFRARTRWFWRLSGRESRSPASRHPFASDQGIATRRRR